MGTEEGSRFDGELAELYGADMHGMRKYVLALLRRGPRRDIPAEERRTLQEAHLKNIGRMAEAGKLVLAGPFLGNGDLRGIYVFCVPTIEEAEALVRTDPAIRSGSLEMELLEWYGSAALMAVDGIHRTLERVGVTERSDP